LHKLGEFTEFALADVSAKLNILPLLREFADDIRPGGSREAPDFVARVVCGPRLVGQRDADENGLLAGD